MDKNKQKDNGIAGRNFHYSDYEGTSQLEKGLAETHEQVSDDYYAGTIERTMSEDHREG